MESLKICSDRPIGLPATKQQFAELRCLIRLRGAAAGSPAGRGLALPPHPRLARRPRLGGGPPLSDHDLGRSEPSLDRGTAVDLAEPSIDSWRASECIAVALLLIVGMAKFSHVKAPTSAMEYSSARKAASPSLRSKTCTNLTASPTKRRTAEADPSSAETKCKSWPRWAPRRSWTRRARTSLVRGGCPL